MRLRLQLAAQVLERKLDARAAAAAVPELVQRALQCLSAHCRHDAAATQALATLMAVAARRAAAAAAAPGSNGGTWLYQELLLPLVRSSWRDPEPRRVAAGCSVMAGVLASLAPMVQQPHVALALRAGLVAALEAMWGGATARRVSAAYTPLRQWVAAVGGERLGADGARRLAAICCRGAADKDAWQVRCALRAARGRTQPTLAAAAALQLAAPPARRYQREPGLLTARCTLLRDPRCVARRC